MNYPTDSLIKSFALVVQDSINRGEALSNPQVWLHRLKSKLNSLEDKLKMVESCEKQ